MSNEVKIIGMLDHTYYFFNDIINIKKFNLDKMKIFLFTALNM